MPLHRARETPKDIAAFNFVKRRVPGAMQRFFSAASQNRDPGYL
jgi:hypothetical protein